jgi:hypothetical protein
VLNSQGEALSGPSGEQLALLLGAMGSPLVDPIGRPVMVALQPGSSKPLGVHPDGSIVTVPASKHVAPAAAPADSTMASTPAAAEPAAAAGGGLHAGLVQRSDAAAGCSSLKEAGSYAPSLARSSSNSPLSVAAGPVTTITENNATNTAAAGVDAGCLTPAELLLGPHGKPLLGVDNRPLIVAVDEEGVPLVRSSEGGVLLGSDDRPLVLATASDGSLVALDSQCRPLTGTTRHPNTTPDRRQDDACAAPCQSPSTVRNMSAKQPAVVAARRCTKQLEGCRSGSRCCNLAMLCSKQEYSCRSQGLCMVCVDKQE